MPTNGSFVETMNDLLVKDFHQSCHLVAPQLVAYNTVIRPVAYPTIV